MLAIQLFAITLVLNGQNSAFLSAKKYYAQKNDTLKLRILKFIEDNIKLHASRCFEWQDSTGNTINIDESNFENFSEYRKEIKLKQLEIGLKTSKKIVEDSKCITDKILITNIDRAVNAWSMPWNKNLSYSDFCEYLLPYRVQDEPLEDWVNIYRDRFAMLQKNTAVEICNKANLDLKQWFFSSFSFGDKTELSYCLSPTKLLSRKEGSCQDLCNLSIYVMRTLGLACSIDFTPAWATSSYSHFWCTYINENGEHKPFEGVTGMADDFVVYREPSKVFRITFSNPKNTLANKIPLYEIPRGHLQMKNIIDVTSNYWRTTSVQCKIKKSPQNKIAYVGVFNALNWKPVDWSFVSNGWAQFKNLSVGAIYIPLLYSNMKISPAGYPVLIRADKSVQTLIPDFKQKITITVAESTKYLIYRLNKKYTFYYWDGKWVKVTTKVATETKQLTFENIPANTLYLLLPEYSEKKERVFTISNGGEIERW